MPESSQSPEPVPSPNSIKRRPGRPANKEKKPPRSRAYYLRQAPRSAGAEIRKKLGLTDEQMKGVPALGRMIREGYGSRDRAVEILEGDDSQEARAFLEVWNKLPAGDRHRVRIEEVVIASGMTVRRFWEVLNGALFDESNTISRAVILLNRPRAIKATIRSAVKGDASAQKLFHTMTGDMPLPKGSVMNINLNQLNQPKEPEKQQLERMDNFLLELQDVAKPRQLAAPVIPVEMPAGAPEIEYLGLDE